jgi:aldose 1-epimerase
VIPPSGEQFEIACGDQRVVVVEVGAGLRSWDGVLDGYRVDEMCLSARGEVLAPWPNRLADGRYTFDGETYELPLNDRNGGAAIHGFVRWASWRAVEHTDARVALEHVLHPQPGYPFTLRLRVEYSLAADGLSVRTTAENIGDRACPFGAGHHPYIARSADSVFGPESLDDCRRWEGEQQIGDVTVWADDAWPYVQLYTGDDRPDVARRAVAVEPMTCPPNAFNTGEGLIRLEPGEGFEGRWGISVRLS